VGKMRHILIIKEHHIHFYIGSCPECGKVKQVKNTRSSDMCLDCINKKVNDKGFMKTNKINAILIGMTSKEVIAQIEKKRNKNMNIMSISHTHTTWQKIEKMKNV
jgi:hypothetical protein